MIALIPKDINLLNVIAPKFQQYFTKGEKNNNTYIHKNWDVYQIDEVILKKNTCQFLQNDSARTDSDTWIEYCGSLWSCKASI